MKYTHTRFALIGGAILAIAAIGPRLRAQASGSGEIVIYRGDPGMQTGVLLNGWGSGEARETGDHVFIGSKSIKVTTHGSYQGGRIMLDHPVDLKQVASDKSAYLQLAVLLPTSENASRGGYGPGGYGPMGRGGRMMGGPGGPGGPGGRGGYGGAGQRGGDNTQFVKPKTLTGLRMVLVTDDGKTVETDLPVSSAAVAHDDWSTLAVPLIALKGLADTDAKVKEFRVFGDSSCVVYIGQIRVLHDDTPIRVDELVEKTVAVNDPVTFTASAEAGASPLKYEWDFDSNNGQAVDAEGKTVTHKYRKSRHDANGNSIPFVVTLTVSDPYGLKKPVTRTTQVNVTL